MVVSAREPHESGRDYALRLIKQNIITLELAPGAMVSESELATALGLSRTPVREALMELAKIKIVEILPQKGSRVAPIDYTLVEESNFTRLVLETAVVALACHMAQPADWEELTANLHLQEFYVEHPDMDQSLRLDNEFHAALFRIAQKQQTYEMMNAFTIHFDRVRRMSIYAVKGKKTLDEHRQLLDALKLRDDAQAQAIMQKHLTRFQIDKEQIIRDYPEYFPSGAATTD